MILEYKSITTAPFAIAPKLVPSDNLSGIKSAADIIEGSRYSAALRHYPLFLKPACEGSSKGIYSWSKVRNAEELETALKKLRIQFSDQSILIEKFLAGREYTVSVVGTGSSARVIGTIHQGWRILPAKTSPPLSATQEDAPLNGVTCADFYAGDMKADNKHMAPTQISPDRADPEVQAAERIALETWQALECYDVGRVDIRFDNADPHPVPYVLEASGSRTEEYMRGNR